MMRQYDKQKIARILSKFMAGETSLDEEQLLAEYFRTHEVGNEWQEYKEMFALFDSGAVDIEQEAKPTAKPKVVPFRWIMTGIAASILLLIGFSILIKYERPTEQQPVVTETIEQNTQQSTSSEPIIEEKKEAPQKPSEPAQKFHQANKPHKVPQEPLLAQAEPATEAPARNYSEETASNSSNPYLIVTTQLQDLRSRGERLDREVAMMMHN